MAGVIVTSSVTTAKAHSDYARRAIMHMEGGRGRGWEAMKCNGVDNGNT